MEQAYGDAACLLLPERSLDQLSHARETLLSHCPRCLQMAPRIILNPNAALCHECYFCLYVYFQLLDFKCLEIIVRSKRIFDAILQALCAVQLMLRK